VKTHNSSRIIFSGHTLAIKTVTAYSAKFNADHTVFGNAIHSFSSIVIASSTLTINIGLLISPTMISNGSPVPSPCIKQSDSAVLSQWRAALRPMSVDVSKPFRFRKGKFILFCVCIYVVTPWYRSKRMTGKQLANELTPKSNSGNPK